MPAEKAGTDYTKLRKSPRKYDQSQMGNECHSMECLQEIPHPPHAQVYACTRVALITPPILIPLGEVGDGTYIFRS